MQVYLNIRNNSNLTHCTHPFLNRVHLYYRCQHFRVKSLFGNILPIFKWILWQIMAHRTHGAGSPKACWRSSERHKISFEKTRTANLRRGQSTHWLYSVSCSDGIWILEWKIYKYCYTTDRWINRLRLQDSLCWCKFGFVKHH